MKKRKEEIVQNKEQSTVQSNDTYVYDVDILTVFAIGVYEIFAYNASQSKNKKTVNEKQDQPPKRCPML